MNYETQFIQLQEKYKAHVKSTYDCYESGNLPQNMQIIRHPKYLIAIANTLMQMGKINEAVGAFATADDFLGKSLDVILADMNHDGNVPTKELVREIGKCVCRINKFAEKYDPLPGAADRIAVRERIYHNVLVRSNSKFN